MHFSVPVRRDSRCFLVDGDSEVDCDGAGMREVLVVGEVVVDPDMLFLLPPLLVLSFRECPLILEELQL